MNYSTTAGSIPAPASRVNVIDYYNATTADFADWSEAGNLHFGYCDEYTNTYDREAQLAQMNTQVGVRLGLCPNDAVRIIDLGCGTGATCRQLLQENSGWHAIGINVVPKQVKVARSLTRDARLNDRATFLCEDFTNTSFPPQRFDGALAIESTCYGTGYSKTDFLREAKRLLRPGARLVMADALLTDARPLPRLLETCHRHMCASWAFDTLAQRPALERALAELGFVDIRFEDISAKVLPSALHVPGVTSAFWLQLLRNPAAATPARRGHAVAPVLALLLSLAHSRLRYFLVSATRG